MSTISEIKQRAKALGEKTEVNSVTPKEVGGIMYDLGSYGEHIMRNGGTLGIRKVYASIEEMEADNTNPVDLWGDPIKKGNLVVIYDGANGEHNNEVYAFLNPGWIIATNFDAGYSMKAEVDAKLSELASKLEDYKIRIATDEVVGGIIAEAKDEHYVEDVRIDPETGKLYTKGITVEGDIAPDEEDLTATIEEGKAVVRFRDRGSERGKGYVILRANKPIFEQLTQENTIYEIRYDFDLGGETLEVPANCVIEFKGGSFSNGTLKGNNTGIIANPTKIFGENLYASGTWQIDHAYAEWFGAVADDTTDCYSAINKALSMNNSCRLLKGVYRVNNGIVLSNYMKLTGQKGNNTVVRPIQGSSMDAIITIGSSDGSVASTHGCLRDLSIWASPNIGVKCAYGSQAFDVENIDIKYCAGAGLFVSKCWYMSFMNINSWENKYGIELNGTEVQTGDTAVNGISFYNCWLNQNTHHALYSNGHTTALSFIGCTFESTQSGSEVCFEHMDTDATFIGCYVETYRVGFEITADYSVGLLNIQGGRFSFHSPVDSLFKIGTLVQFGLIGAMITIDNTASMGNSSCINTSAGVNIIASRLPNTPNAISATGQVVNLVKYGAYSGRYKGCDIRTLDTSALYITDGSPVSDGCAAKMYLGKYEVNANTSIAYGIVGLGLEIKQTESYHNDRAYLKLFRANGNRNDKEESQVMTITNYGDVAFGGRVSGSLCSTSGSTANRPAWSVAHVGLIYFDTDLGKPIFMKDDGVWVDATGTQV